MKGADRCCENPRNEHSRWRRPEFHSRGDRLPCRRVGNPTGGASGWLRDVLGTLRPIRAASARLGSPGVGSRVERRLPCARLGTACRVGAAAGLDPTRRLVSPGRLCAAAGVGRTLRRTTFRSVPPAALRVGHALKIELTMSSPMPIPAPVTIAWPNRPPRKRCSAPPPWLGCG